MTKNERSLICEALLRVEMRDVRLMDKFPDVDIAHSKEYTDNMQSLFTTKAKKQRRLTKKQLIAAIIAAAFCSIRHKKGAAKMAAPLILSYSLIT